MPVEPQARPRIYLTVGLPGSGKSTWLAERKLPALSSDAVRALLLDDVTDQTNHGRVFATVRYLLRQRLAIGRPATYIDATNLTRAERLPYVRIAQFHACAIEAIFFDIALEECLRRNQNRARIVPPDAIAAMALKLQVPERNEGFCAITRLSVASPEY